MSRTVSLVVLLAIIAIIGLLFYRVMVGFFVPLFLAATLVVVFRPLHRWILARLPGRQHVAAAVTTISILLIVLVPAMVILSVATVQGTALITDFNANSLELVLQQSRERLGLDLAEPELLHRLDAQFAQLSAADSLDDAREIAVQVRPSIDRFYEMTKSLHATGSEPAIERLTERLQQLEQSETLGVPAPEEAPGEESVEIIVPVETPLEPRSTLVVDFESMLLATVDSYRTAKDLALGGPLRATFVQLANPAKEDLQELTRSVIDWLQPRLLTITSATGEFLVRMLIGVIVLIIATYFFLLDSQRIIQTLMKLSPLDDRYEETLLTEFDRVSRAVVLATLLSAIAQGILAAIGYSLAGLNSVILLSLMTGVMAMVPFLGAASIWLPASLWLMFVTDRPTAGIFLAIYGAAVISSVDNVIKAFVLHGHSQLHPLLALLSVLGGVQVFGPIGILVGPMVVVFLQSLLEILNRELTSGQRATGAPGSPGTGKPPTYLYRTALRGAGYKPTRL